MLIGAPVLVDMAVTGVLFCMWSKIKEENMRRVVTGHRNGKSVILDDKEIPGQGDAFPGFFPLWKTESIPVIPMENEDYKQTLPFHFPEPECTTVVISILPPDEVMLKVAGEKGIDLDKAHRDMFNDKRPMHTTDTIDFDIVMSGEIWMEVDDGIEVHLKPFDCVVMNGTRHGWHNKGTENCVIASFQVGAERK
jgi:mannose-6-phosphate isomerase-like protein (cupin superfamily)